MVNIFNSINIYILFFISLFIYFIFFILFDLIYYTNLFYIYINYYIINIDLNIFSNYLLLYNVIISYICLFFFFFKINNNFKINFFIFNATIIIIIGLFTINNIYTFFFFYELLMIPSIILIFFSSPSLRSKIITIYFILWTQLGSFFIFIALIFLYKYNYIFYKNILNINLYYSSFICFLVFFGFGIKIPIWPFHFWITKVHVEVNTAFSIYLSGVLVKVALLGLYKFSSLYMNFFYWKVLIIVILIGILDVSLKINNQIDFKKIVAFCTIFEMNIILLNLIFLNYLSIYFILYFCILHTSLSFLLFFFSDIFYRKFNTRCLNSLTGVINNYFLLCLIFIFTIILFNGIPFTLKFNLEVLMLTKLLNINLIVFYLFLFIQSVFLIYFNKIMYGILFGLNSYIVLQKSKHDLNLFEFSITFFNFLILILL